MANVKKHGTHFWWVGATLTCGYCRCVWETERTDTLLRQDDAGKWINVACPDCNATVSLTMDDRKPKAVY